MNAIVDFVIDVVEQFVWIGQRLTYLVLLLGGGILLPLSVACLASGPLVASRSNGTKVQTAVLIGCGLMGLLIWWVWFYRVRDWLDSRSWL